MFSMKWIVLFSFLVNLIVYSEDFDQLHPLTDLDGRTLDAKLIHVDSDSINLTIEWNGRQFDLPIDSLDQDSRDLVERFKDHSSLAEEGVYEWVDVTGRSLVAKFIKLDGQVLALEINGKISSLPLSMFDQDSQALAQTLSGPLSNTTEKTDPLENLDLSKIYSWSNKEGSVVKGRFVGFSKTELSIVVAGGTREIAIPMAVLSSNSQELAKKLNHLFLQQAEESVALAKKRKEMKLPELSESDLEKEHQFTNSKGQSIRAVFLDANDQSVSLMLPGRSDPIELNWQSFSEDSTAKLEALRRKNHEVSSKKPRIVPAKDSKLSYFASGKFKGFNTVLEQENYVVAIPSTGTGMYFYIKQEGYDPELSPLGTKRMTVGFRARYIDRSESKRARSRSRRIVKFESSPDASTDREEITLTGTYDNGGSFEYNIELSKDELRFWSKIKDPGGEKWPTRNYLGIGLPNVVSSDVRDMEMAKIKAIVGDGAFYFSPMEGKRTRIPFDQSWKDIRKKNNFNGNNLKLLEATGKPYEPVKINVSAVNFRNMRLDFDKAYTKTFPLQGISLTFGAEEETKRTEVPRSNALKINISRSAN